MQPPSQGLLLRSFRYSPVELLQNVESFLALADVEDQALAITVVLDFRQRAPRGAKIHQKPWRHRAERWDPLQHANLVNEEIGPAFLGPALVLIAVSAVGRATAEFADDERLGVGGPPLHPVRALPLSLVPTHVFIQSQHV